MKKAKEWIQQLPPDVQERFIKNINDPDYLLEFGFYSLQETFSSCFVWNHTPEGYNYWHKLFKKL